MKKFRAQFKNRNVELYKWISSDSERIKRKTYFRIPLYDPCKDVFCVSHAMQIEYFSFDITSTFALEILVWCSGIVAICRQ